MSLVRDLYTRGVLTVADIAILKSVFKDSGYGDDQTFNVSTAALKTNTTDVANIFLPQLDIIGAIIDDKLTVLPATKFGISTANTSDQSSRVSALLQEAADHVSGGQGVFIVLPPGEISVRTPVTPPRRGWTSSGMFSMVGQGQTSTIFSDSGYLGDGGYMFDFLTTTTGTATAYMTLRGIQFQRSGDGGLWRHNQPTSDTTNERLVRCRFEDLYMRAKFSSTGSVTATLLDIIGGVQCVFDTVSFDGGSIGFRLKDSSYCEVRNCQTSINRSCKNGFLVDGGGGHKFTTLRAEECDGGYGLKFTGQTHENKVDGFSCEGNTMTPQLWFHSCNNVKVEDVGIAIPTANNAVGILFDATAQDCHVDGGRVKDFSGVTGGVGIKWVAGAKHCTVGPKLQAAYRATSVPGDLDPLMPSNLLRCRAEFMTGSTPDERRVIQSGFHGTITADSPSVREQDIYNVTYNSGGNLATITDGYVDQRLTLRFTNGNCTVKHGTGNILLASGADVNPATNKTMELSYDGTNWLQV